MGSFAIIKMANMRIITHTITFIFILSFFTSSFAQNGDSEFLRARTFKGAVISRDQQPSESVKAPLTVLNHDSCRAVQTTWTGGNSNDGIMVNVHTNSWITIENFSVYINSFDSGYVKIYYIADSAAGHEQAPGDWTFIDSAFVTGSGTTTPVMIPIDVDVTMPAWSFYSFYITGTGTPNIIYSSAANSSVTAYDSTITLWPGAGLSYPFGQGGNVNQNRLFNGIVHYCEAPVSVGETTFSNEISIAPNPFNEYTDVIFDSPVNKADVIVYNILGEEVKRVNADNAKNVRISRDGLNAGIYLVNVISEGRNIAVKKIVIE